MNIHTNFYICILIVYEYKYFCRYLCLHLCLGICEYVMFICYFKKKMSDFE